MFHYDARSLTLLINNEINLQLLKSRGFIFNVVCK